MNPFYLSLLWERMRTWRLRSFERLPASTLAILLCPRLRICSWARLERRPLPTCGMIYDAFAEFCLYFVQLLVRGHNLTVDTFISISRHDLGWFWLDLFSVLTPCPPCYKKL